MQNIVTWIINKQNEDGFKWKYQKNVDKIHNFLKLQIHNSLDNGWDKSDIIIATNFDFEYMGVKAYVTKKEICTWSAFANKLVIIDELIKENIICKDIWMHDADAFQISPFVFPEECLDWGYSMSTRLKKIQGGSGFYRTSGYDIISDISKCIKKFKPIQEESFFPSFYLDGKERVIKEIKSKMSKLNGEDGNGKVMQKLNDKLVFAENFHGKFKTRFSRLDPSYNMSIVHQFGKKYPNAKKPIKIVHFNPLNIGCVDCFVNGKNMYNVKITTERLDNLLVKYGFLKKRGGNMSLASSDLEKEYIENPGKLYDEGFFKGRKKGKNILWQGGVGKILVKEYNLNSIVDFGCALGYFLEGAIDSGVKNIKGFEYLYDNAKPYLSDKVFNFISYGNVMEKIECGKFEMAMSVEVAEHICPEKSDVFVDNLVRASSKYILLTAAPIGQGGRGHINEQDKIFWIEKIERNGFIYLQDEANKITSLLKNNRMRCPRFFSRNLMFFKREKGDI